MADTFTCDYCGEEFKDDGIPIVAKSGPFAGERYCSQQCKREANGYTGMSSEAESRWERRQMGLT